MVKKNLDDITPKSILRNMIAKLYFLGLSKDVFKIALGFLVLKPTFRLPRKRGIIS